MAEMDQASQAAWPQELEGTAPRTTAGMSDTLATAARHADLLADTAREIPATVDLKQLSLAERQAFLAIAETLHRQAGELADSARAGDLSAMHRVRDELAATCNACHQRFRDVSGPM
jgi:hypothetical protein